MAVKWLKTWIILYKRTLRYTDYLKIGNNTNEFKEVILQITVFHLAVKLLTLLCQYGLLYWNNVHSREMGSARFLVLLFFGGRFGWQLALLRLTLSSTLWLYLVVLRVYFWFWHGLEHILALGIEPGWATGKEYVPLTLLLLQFQNFKLCMTWDWHNGKSYHISVFMYILSIYVNYV